MSNPRAIAQVSVAASATEGAGVTLETKRPDLFSSGLLVELYPQQYRDGAPLSRAAYTVRFLISSIVGEVLTGTMNYDDYDNPPLVEKGWIIDGRNLAAVPNQQINNQSQLQAALNALADGGQLVAMPGTVNITSKVTIPAGLDDVLIDLSQLKLVAPVANYDDTMIEHLVATGVGPATLNANALRGDRTVTLTAGGVAAIGAAAQTLLTLIRPTLTQVTEVPEAPVGDVVKLSEIIGNDFTTGTTAVYRSTFAARCRVYLWLDGNHNTGHINGFGATGFRDSYINVKAANFKDANASAPAGGSACASILGYNNLYEFFFDHCGSAGGGGCEISDSKSTIVGTSVGGFFPFKISNAVHTSFRNVAPSYPTTRGIKITQSSYWHLENCSVYRSTSTGIDISFSSTDGLVSSCKAHGCVAQGLRFDATANVRSLVEGGNFRFNGAGGAADTDADVAFYAGSDQNYIDAGTYFGQIWNDDTNVRNSYGGGLQLPLASAGAVGAPTALTDFNGSAYSARGLDDTLIEGLYWMLNASHFFPYMKLYVTWAQNAAGAGNVLFQGNAMGQPNSDVLDLTGIINQTALVAAGGTQHQSKISVVRITPSNIVPPFGDMGVPFAAPPMTARVGLARIGNDGTDTLVGDANIVAVKLDI